MYKLNFFKESASGCNSVNPKQTCLAPLGYIIINNVLTLCKFAKRELQIWHRCKFYNEHFPSSDNGDGGGGDDDDDDARRKKISFCTFCFFPDVYDLIHIISICAGR